MIEYDGNHKVIETKQIMLTPEKAQELLDGMEKNRNISIYHCGRISEAITRGEWKINNDSICVDKDGALINGQHRCNAVVSTGISVPVLYSSGYEPDDIFAIDQGIKKRSLSDSLSVRGYSHSIIRGSALNWLNIYILSAYLKKSADTVSRRAVTSTAGMIEAERHERILPSLKYIVKLHKNCPFSVSAGMMVFLHYAFSQDDEYMAGQFMESLLLGVNISAGSPIVKMRNKLIINSARIKKEPRHILFIMVIKTWNIYRKGVGSTLYYNPSRDRFPLIMGSPFKEMYSVAYPPGTNPENKGGSVK